jgi:flagellar motor switch protein FliN/FliY
VCLELGRARLSDQELHGLQPGSVLALDRAAGDPVRIVMDDRTIAQGEVLVVDGKFAVRVTERQ